MNAHNEAEKQRLAKRILRAFERDEHERRMHERFAVNWILSQAAGYARSFAGVEVKR